MKRFKAILSPKNITRLMVRLAPCSVILAILIEFCGLLNSLAVLYAVFIGVLLLLNLYITEKDFNRKDQK